MNDSSSHSSGSASNARRDLGFSPWERLKSKRISYLTLPLLLMATVTEFVILSTGWKYQQVVCLPQGMGVTFFGIGPIGATILAVELLKLPLAIWTASRFGWQKAFMLCVGLPLICVLTFQLVKDMAVYEMGVAMTPASQFLEKATTEETKIAALNAELKGVEEKRAEHDRKLAELAAKQAKAKAELEDSLKRNDAARQDAISLTDYQKKELSEVEARQANIIAQFNADTEQINKTLADLRARREVEVSRATKWNAEEARLENEFKAKMTEYANRKAAYDKAKAEYDGANFLKRQLMHEPVSPGVPPVREDNTILKPTLVAELDEQIKAKEAELISVNSKRRDRVAQVDADARRLREEFDKRSGTKREEADKKREEFTSALATLANEEKAQREQIEKEYESVVAKVDGIRSEIDACRKKAEGYYEAREASIRRTQVHRIATTVEIVRGLIKGERPMSIKATAKERGDILTDQISMVRIWVYPVLAFIVAFLPTLMVEIGFSTVFEPEQQRPAHRLGFFGRRMHELYTRAGRLKILRAERLANEASAEIAAREQALSEVRGAADKALFDKDNELNAARDALAAATAKHEEQLARVQAAQAEESKKKEEEWVAKLAGMADTLNRTVLEKDALRDLQKSEVERQIQMRQNAWSDRISQMRQELDAQRAASEAERTTLMQEHHKKLMEVSEDCKNQVIQARRQAADAEMAVVEATAKLNHDLKEALLARDGAEAQLKQQADAFALKLAQAKEDAAREIEKATRQEKHRSDRQQLEFAKTLRQREDDFAHQLKQREQELTLAFDARLAEEQTRIEQNYRKRETEFERQFEARALEVDARWKQELQQREEATQTRLKQREQQLQAQADARLAEVQTQTDQEARRRESEFERQLETQSREADARLKQELQQKELALQAKLKQREQELALRAEARESELNTQFAADLRKREEEWERQAEARVRAVETRLGQEAQQKEELFLSKSRQRDQQWQAKLDAVRSELQAQTEEVRRRREEADAAIRELETNLRNEMQQKEEAAQAKARQREQDIVDQLTAQAEVRQMAAQALWEKEAEKKVRAALEPFKALLARTEKEKDEARESASEHARQAQQLEKKLTEASTFLSTWRNGNNFVGTDR
ncbi:MAG TPA: hypothetical protein VFE51_23975 [Verrucomicrobiae bacterium]|nr:hypothetical protein [Verrucomicrobiae bacterium]